MDKNKRAALLRKLLVSAVLMVLLGLLFSFYYLAYIPKQQSIYNKRTFRILNEVSNNFTTSVVNLETVTGNNRTQTYQPLYLKESDTALSRDSIITKVVQSLGGAPNKTISLYRAVFKNDSIYFTGANAGDTASKIKTVKSIIEPIINIHEDIFDALMLIKTDTFNNRVTGNIIYKTNEINIDPEINVDSILQKTAFISPCIKNVSVEAVNYKLFIFPFRIHKQQFLLGGFITAKVYKSESQQFPLHPLSYASVLLLIILCSLPFLKIYLLAPQENITIRDIRAIICVTYMIPFFFILLMLGYCLYKGADKRSTESLRVLYKNVTDNFYTEINDCITQLKSYDSLVNKQLKKPADFKQLIETSVKEKADFKDLFFYPHYYKNLDGIAWVNKKGYDIGKWNFIDTIPPYLDKSERDFVNQIRWHAGYRVNGSDTFSIQSTLSRAVGEYNINIAIHSSTSIDTSKAMLFSVIARMYSVTNPVVPPGENFCIVDEDGTVLYHSETERALHENIFKEAENTLGLRIALKHKDSVLLHNVNIYNKNVKMLAVPLKGLPYYIILYSDKRLEHLFLGHIMLFSFFCVCLLLLLVTFVTLFFYYIRRKNTELFISDEAIGFSKPTPSKEQFYKNIIVYCFVILVLFGLASLFFSSEPWLYFVLNFSILSPFFSLFGYYILNLVDSLNIQRQKNYKQALRLLIKPSYFRTTLFNIIAVYATVIFVFYIIKLNVTTEAFSVSKTAAEILLIIFEILFPALAIYIGLIVTPGNFFIRKIIPAARNIQQRYLTYFLIAILLSVVLTSVLPAIGLVVNATNQEKILTVKSGQILLAEDIQQRRINVNKKLEKVKINTANTGQLFKKEDTDYIKSLKFDAGKGIYLQYSTLTPYKYWSDDSTHYSNSLFYKKITQFLRLPADHVHYYKNADDYYYWEKTDSSNQLKLNYHSTSDYKDTSNFSLTAPFSRPITFFSIFRKPLALYCIIGIAIFFVCFYNLLHSIAKKIFLVGYFEAPNVAQQDTAFLENYFDAFTVTEPFEIKFWGKEKINLYDVHEKERAENKSLSAKEETILKIQTLLTPVYDNIWNALTPEEKFIIYDFASDSFTNYKNTDILYSLYKKGLLVKRDHNLVLFSRSFGNYLVSKKDTKPIEQLTTEVSGGGRWGNFKTIFYVLLFAGVAFLFVVQEDTSKKLIAVFTALATLVPLMIKLFDSGSSPTNESVKK